MAFVTAAGVASTATASANTNATLQSTSARPSSSSGSFCAPTRNKARLMVSHTRGQAQKTASKAKSTSSIKMTDMFPITLQRFIIETAMANADLPHLKDMENLVSAIQLACKQIRREISKAPINNMTGLAGDGNSKSINIQGEEQKKLDVLSNEILKNALRYTGKLSQIASEEEDEPVLIDEMSSGSYISVFDPLDGSSNIDAGIATGTIFGIFEDNCSVLSSDWQEKVDAMQYKKMFSTMQPGSNLKCAGYCIYSSSTMLVITFGNGVHGFTLDPELQEFVLTHPNMTIPNKGKIYSVNEANSLMWDPEVQQYIQDFKQEGYTSRYIGSLVADVHRTILYGGVYIYPSDAKNKNGKLRLLYECAPIAFIMEQAGGMASTGKHRIMDILPKEVHQRNPLVVGGKYEVQKLIDMYEKSKAQAKAIATAAKN